MLKSCQHKANEDTTNLKNDDGSYRDDAFQNACNTIFNFVAAKGHHIVAGDLMLYFMRSNKKKHINMSPKHFLTCFEKPVWAVKVLDRHYEAELTNTKAILLFFWSFPQSHIKDYLWQDHLNFD